MFMKMVLSFLMKHGLGLVIGLVVCAALWKGHSYLKEQEHQKTEMRQKIEILTKDRDTAVQNTEIAKGVAKNNELAVEELRNDIKKQADVTATLNQRVDKSNQFAKNLTEKIFVVQPAQDGAVSDVLKSTIDAIQKKNEAKK